jgi:transcription elongation factor GreA
VVSVAYKYIYMTSKGLRKLEEELEYLRLVKRHEIAQRLREATEEGGELEENFAYEIAKTEQSFVEGRIKDIEERLAQALLIEPGAPSDVAQIGSTVIIQEDGGEPEAYTIVGASEGNPREKTITYLSPLGQALLNHHAGEKVIVKTPAGMLRFRIIKVN